MPIDQNPIQAAAAAYIPSSFEAAIAARRSASQRAAQQERDIENRRIVLQNLRMNRKISSKS